jgi:WD40 repeat protein
MRPICVCALAFLFPALVVAGPHRIGGEDGFRIGQLFELAVPSGDGKLFALAGKEGGFHVLDASTGRVIQTWEGCPPVRSLTFDTVGRLLVLFADGWVRTYDPVHGHCRREVLLADSEADENKRPRFLPGGHFVEITWHAGTIAPLRILATATGQPVGCVNDLDLYDTVTPSPDGKRLAVLRREPGPNSPNPARKRGIDVIDLRLGKVIASVPPPTGWADRLAFRPGGHELLVSIGADLTLFDLANGQSRVLKLEGWPIYGLADPIWSPDGRRLAMCQKVPQMESRACEWDVATGRLLRDESAGMQGPDAIAYTSDGRLLWWNTTGRRLDVREPGRPALVPPTGHTQELRDLAFGANDTLVTLDATGALCRWDTRTGALMSRAQVPSDAGTPRLDPLGRTVLLERGNEFTSFDVASSRLGPVRKAPIPDRISRTPTAAALLSPDGRWFLDWDEGRGRLYDNDHERATWLPPDDQLWSGPRDRTSTASWSPDGRWLAVTRRMTYGGEEAQEFAILQLPGGRLVTRLRVRRERDVRAPLFTPDGSLLLVSHLERVEAYEVATGRLRYQYRHPAAGAFLYPLACSPDNRLLLVLATGLGAHGRAELQLIELATGSVRRTHPWPAGAAHGVTPRLSPDGRRVAIALKDATVQLLNTDSEASSPTEPDALWQNLASPDAAVAGTAVLAAARRPDAERWIRSHLTEPEPAAEPEQPASFWLAELDHDDPARREAARRHLARQPGLLPALEAALTGAHSPEVRRALAELRETADEPPTLTPDTLRRLRLTEALDRLGGPAARR